MGKEATNNKNKNTLIIKMHSTIEKSKMFFTQIPNEKNNVQIPL